MRFLLLLICCLSLSLCAQHSPNETITTVFAAMKAGDTTGLRAWFHPDATLHSVVTKPDGHTVVSAGSIDKWFIGIQGEGPQLLIDVNNYAPGMYWVRCRSAEKLVSRRVIIR